MTSDVVEDVRPKSEGPRPTSVRRLENGFAAGLVLVTLLGLWCRLDGLSRGSLFRDDAWVALTSRVPLHTAWRMVGTAPFFTLFERDWVTLTAPSTLMAQLPTLAISVTSIIVIGLAARYVGLSRSAALLAASLVALSPIDVAYATHLKPYAGDVLTATLVLVTVEAFRRGRSAWWFVGASLIGVSISFSTAPVVIGGAIVLGTTAIRRERESELTLPALATVVPLGLLYLAARPGISPRLSESWAPNFVDWHSLSTVGHSLRHIIEGLVGGFIDTTPHWHVSGLSKALLAGVIIAALLGLLRPSTWAAGAAVLVSFVLAAAHLAPLGTGRTDAFLYPALALLVASGAQQLLTWVRRWWAPLARVGAAALLVVVGFLAADASSHRPRYPGGSIDPVALAARQVIQAGGAVLIEGTARWPWTYYETTPVRLVFGPKWNTGFAPKQVPGRIEVMQGTEIEGGYHPLSAVSHLGAFRTILYVRTDDWPGLGSPLQNAFDDLYYSAVRSEHVPGYQLVWEHRG